MCNVDPRGLPCFELEADEEHATVINEDDEGEETGGLVTGSPGQKPSSPLSSEEE